MRVVVIGAGGVGGFLAALLNRAGNEVSVLARGRHLEAIRQHGLQLRSQQFGDMTSRPIASDDPAKAGRADLAILGVKMYDFAQAAEATKVVLENDGAAITIQNGLDAPDELARVIGPERVLIGTASIEAAIVEPGVIGHLVPIHSMTLSPLVESSASRLEKVSEALRSAEINVSVVDDGRQALWNKAASLIPIATMTAAAGAGIGPIYQLDESRALFQALFTEAASVAAASGHAVEAAQAGFMAMMGQAAKVRPDFTTSMDRDFRKGKRTELEWLTGALVRLAAKHQLDAPLHRTLYAVLKLRERQALGRTG
jgi:2-dehydropantoate 2-reductase